MDGYVQNADGSWSLKSPIVSLPPNWSQHGAISLIERTKQRHDIVDVVGAYVNLRKARSSEYIGKCPFHEDRHPSLNVSSDKQKFHCFGCQSKGDVIDFIIQVENLDTKEACLFLNGKA